MVSSKKEHPKLNPNKPKKKSVKDLVIKKFDKSGSTMDYSSEFKNVNDEDINARPQLRDTELETTILKTKEPNDEPIIEEESKSSTKPFDSMKDVTTHPDSETESKSKTNVTLDDFMETRPKLKEEMEVEEEGSNDEEIMVEVEDESSGDEEMILEVEEEITEESLEPLKEEEDAKTSEEDTEKTKSSSIDPIGSVKGVIKKFEPEQSPAKPTLNPSPNNLKPKDSVIKEVIKKTESEVKSASDNTIGSVKGVIKKLDSESKPTLNPSPNELPKTRQIEEEKLKKEIEAEKKEEAENEILEKDEKEDVASEIDDNTEENLPKGLGFVSSIMNLRIRLFGHKVKITDILIVFIGLFFILCGGFASIGVADKVVDNVVFGERSTVSFLLVIVGILFITSVLGPILIKKSAFKGFYEQLQSVDAEPNDTISKGSDSKDKEDTDKKEESDDESEDSE